MDEILGAMAGALVPVAVQWSRYDDQTQQRVRNTRYDLRDLRDAWQESLGWGGAVRSRLPIVMDWDTGLAMATSQQPTAQTIPTLPSGQLRPNLCNGAESFVSSMMWPPRPGMYDARQNVQQVGELSTTALAVTYEEVRTAIHAFVSCNGSTPAGRVQLYRSINALTDTVMSLNLTKAEFAARWAQLFGVPVTTIDPHRDPSKSPTISSINAGNNVASVVFVSTGTNNEVNPQTDAGHRLRITAGAGNIAINAERSHGDFCHSLPLQASRRDDGYSTAPRSLGHSVGKICFRDGCDLHELYHPTGQPDPGGHKCGLLRHC
jgi:hypothetical protein